MTDVLGGVTEFTEIDPTEIHLVKRGANGFPILLAKAVDDSVRDTLWTEVEKAVDGIDVIKACGVHDCAVCAYAASKAKLDAEGRNSLSDSDFAYIDSKGGRHLPIHDTAHVRNALARFNQTHFESDEAKASAHRKIVARAKELGVEVSDDAAKAGVSTDESLSQTREVDAGPGLSGDGRPGDGGEPKAVSFPHGAAGDGSGDTAPDKDLQRGEAGSQTAGAQANKADTSGEATGGTSAGMGGEYGAPGGEVDGGGDKAEKAPFLAMDNAAVTAMGGADADKDPGSPAWEHKDAALADCASHLISRANELIQMLGNRERAEKGVPFFTQETEGAIRQSLQGLAKALADTQPTVSKEEIEMNHDELIKLLDERDEAARQAKKDRKAAKKTKAAETAETTAADAAKGEGTQTAKDATASKAAEDAPTLESVAKGLEGLTELVGQIAGQDGKRAMLSGAGVAAILRGPQGESVLKELEDRVTVAKEANDPVALQTAQFQLTAAKMVARENARERGQVPAGSRFGPGSVELFSRTGSLPDDAAVHGV